MSPTTAERQGLLGLRLQGITLGASQRQPGRMWGACFPWGWPVSAQQRQTSNTSPTGPSPHQLFS